MPIRMVDIAKDLPVALGLDAETINASLETAQHMSYNHWGILADRELNSSLTEYKRGLKLGEYKYGKSFSVVLEGTFPNMVENGADAWDLRDTILKPGTKNLKESKEGHLYASVPFRHFVKDIGKAYADRGFNTQIVDMIKKAVNERRKELDATRSASGKGTNWGGRLPAGLAPKLRERHAVDLFAGMIKAKKMYAKADQAQYVTFRTISNNPDTVREDEGGKNWMHPGLTAKNFADKVVVYAADAFIAELVGAL